MQRCATNCDVNCVAIPVGRSVNRGLGQGGLPRSRNKLVPNTGGSSGIPSVRPSIAQDTVATKLNEQNTAWKALEPYAQLIKSLMPRADALHVFDSAGMLRWTTESMTGPDLPEAVTLVQKEAQADATLVGRVLYIAGEDYPVYVWWLRDEAQRLIASVAITTRKLVEGDGATFDRVHAFVKPAIECLRRELVAQSSILDLHHSISARDEDMALLLSVTDRAEQGTAESTSSLKSLSAEEPVRVERRMSPRAPSSLELSRVGSLDLPSITDSVRSVEEKIARAVNIGAIEKQVAAEQNQSSRSNVHHAIDVVGKTVVMVADAIAG